MQKSTSSASRSTTGAHAMYRLGNTNPSGPFLADFSAHGVALAGDHGGTGPVSRALCAQRRAAAIALSGERSQQPLRARWMCSSKSGSQRPPCAPLARAACASRSPTCGTPTGRWRSWSLTTVNGCKAQRAGDVLGTGTLSGPAPEQGGSLLELTQGGKQPIPCPTAKCALLQDGDADYHPAWGLQQAGCAAYWLLATAGAPCWRCVRGVAIDDYTIPQHWAHYSATTTSGRRCLSARPRCYRTGLPRVCGRHARLATTAQAPVPTLSMNEVLKPRTGWQWSPSGLVPDGVLYDVWRTGAFRRQLHS